MRQSLRGLGLTVYLPTVVFGIGQGAIQPVIALSALALGASVALAGLMVAIVGIGRVAGDLPAGWLADRIGERATILVSLGIYSVGTATCALAGSLWLLAAGVFAVGVSSSVFGLARHSYVTEAAPYEVRGRALSTLGGMMRIGTFVGPFLGAAVVTVGGVSASYWLALVGGLLSALIMLVVPDPVQPLLSRRRSPGDGPAREAVAERGPGIGAVVRAHLPVLRTLGTGALMISAVRASRAVVLPLWADHIGLDPATTSIIFGLAGAMETLLFYPAGAAMDRFGRRAIVVASMVGLGLSLVLLPLTGSALALSADALLMGLANGLGSGINMTVGADASPSVGRPAFLAAFRLLSDVGNGLGPVIVSATVAIGTLGAAIATAAATAGVTALLMARWTPRHGRPQDGLKV